MRSVYTSPPLAPAPARFNLAQHVLAHAERLGEKSALQILRLSGAERWSYARLEAAVRGVAQGFAAMGLDEGAVVLLRLGNGPEFALAFLGAIAAGLVPVPTSAQLTAREITAMAQGLEPALVVAGEGVALPDHPAPILSPTDLRRFENLPPAPYILGSPDRLAYMIFTSGTSGRPRAVRHAHRAVWARQMLVQGWYDLRESDRVMHAGAFNWTYTLGTGLMDPWAAGATALIPAQGVMPQTLPLLMKRFDATIFAAAPGVYRQILNQSAPVSLPKLRHGLSAGEALPEGLRQRWRAAIGTEIFEAMGLSECSTFISGAPHRPAPEGTIGYPQEGRSIAVLGADGAPVARGEVGVLAVHVSDPALYLGYHGAEAESAARRQGEYFLTGDLVEMRADGAIAYRGRADDLMNAGGFRVSPLEVEAAFQALPEAGEVAAVEKRVKSDASVIVLYYTGPASAEALAAHSAVTLARYKQPRLFIARDTLPRNANGKLNRSALRAEEL